MPSLLGLLNVGASSLGAHQAGIAVRGSNIANAQTPGYSRREAIIDEGRGGLHGGGAVAVGVLRGEDFVLSRKIAHQHGELLHRNLLSSGLREVERAVETGQSSLSRKVADLARSLSELAAAPGDPIRRGEVIEKGRLVALEFNRAAHALGRIEAAAGDRAQGLLPRINELARQVAALNRRTAGGSGGTAAPDLGAMARALDQRDELAKTLSGLTGAEILKNADGTIDVLVGGHALVHGAVAQELTLEPSGAALVARVGGAPVGAGGELGAELTVREAAQATLAQIDRLAFDFSATLNAQHALGVGLDGRGGRPFFEPPGAAPGAALGLRPDPALTAQTLGVGFTADPGDNRNALALAGLIEQPVLEGGRASFRNVYARIAAQLGAGVQRAEGEAAVAEDQAAALGRSREVALGVSTDEETARLLAYQRGFEASARFIRAVDELLERLTNL